MKYLLTFTLSLLFLHCYGQRNDYYLLIRDTSFYQTKLGAIEGELSLLIEGNTRRTPEFMQIFQVDSLYLENADLNVSYRLAPQGKDFFWDLTVGFITEESDTIFPSLNLIEGDYRNVKEQKEERRRIRWFDVVENHLEYQKNYNLLINARLFGTPNCEEEEPAFFRPSEQWPHLLVTTLGLAAVTTGQLLRDNAKDEYHTYLDRWSNGASFGEALQFREDAVKNQDNGRTFTVAGIAILGLQAILLGRRYFNVKKQKRYYQKYCTDRSPLLSRLRIDSEAVLLPLGPGLTLPSVKLTYTF